VTTVAQAASENVAVVQVVLVAVARQLIQPHRTFAFMKLTANVRHCSSTGRNKERDYIDKEHTRNRILLDAQHSADDLGVIVVKAVIAYRTPDAIKLHFQTTRVWLTPTNQSNFHSF
jgi:hypothetical protein